MADLKSIAQVCYDSIYPNAGIATSVKVEHFIETAKARYALEMFILSKEQKRSEGEFNIPETLLRDAELDVIDNVADISHLKIFAAADGGKWIEQIGDPSCDCGYIKHTVNLSNILCSDEYNGNKKTAVVFGKKIKFPNGVYADKVPIVYASNGDDLDDDLEVDDAMGSLVEDYLWKRYTGRLPEDRTENSNSNI